jgi:hypothetical protein
MSEMLNKKMSVNQLRLSVAHHNLLVCLVHTVFVQGTKKVCFVTPSNWPWFASRKSRTAIGFRNTYHTRCPGSHNSQPPDGTD